MNKSITLRGLIVGIVAAAIILTVGTLARAQNNIPIQYGDIVTGTIGADKDHNAEFYQFQGQQGDLVSIVAIRRSGNLNPYLILTNDDPSNAKVLGQSTQASNGAVAAIANVTLSETRSYVIAVTHQGLDNGTTAGDFTLVLINGKSQSGGAAQPTAAPEVSPTPGEGSGGSSGESTAEANTSGLNAETFTVGSMPVYSVWNGNNLFVANGGDGTVSMLDGDGNVVKTLKVGGSPFAMVWDGSRLWVANSGTNDKPGNSVTLFDATGKKGATYKVGAEPFSMSYDKQTQRMWIALYGANKIIAVDSSGKTTLTVATKTNPNTVLWTGDTLWATLAGTTDKPGNTVISVDGSGKIKGTFTVGGSPADLAWNDVDQVLYVANYDDGTVSTLDSDGTALGTFKVGNSPSALAWDGTRLWVSLGGDKAVAAFSSKGKLIAQQALEFAPNGITFDGSHIWVAEQGTTDAPGSQITRIDVPSAGGSKQ